MKKCFYFLMFLMACWISPDANAQLQVASTSYKVWLPKGSTLRPYQNYSMQSYQAFDPAQVSSFELVLPEHLVGNGRSWVVSKAGMIHKKYVFRSSDLSLKVECSPIKQAELRCSLKFKKIDINQDEVFKLIQQTYSADELLARMKIAKKFAKDPVGELLIRFEK